ncbi:hypothetical protein JB92DRAFT_3117340 [Gautieria morchelliformis]|nr:hypothetical protein JB92DRAFT_3117340 [Gautieria morchelliformis]
MTDHTTSTSESAATPRTPTRPKFAFDATTIMRKLTKLGYYLGNDDMPTQVAFVPGGCAGDRLVAHDAVNEPQPEEVRLTLVGEVSHDGAWLSAKGAYCPASKLNPGDNVPRRLGSNICAIHDVALKDKAHRETPASYLPTPFPTPLPVPIPSPPPLSEMIPLLGELPPVLFALPVPLQFPTSALRTMSEIKRLA